MAYQTLNRIRSKRGASLMVGLLVFMTCAIIAGVVVSMASVGAGRMTNYAKQEKTFLLQESALGCLAEQLNFKELTLKEQPESSWTSSWKTTASAIGGDSYQEVNANSGIYPVIANALKSVVTTKAPYYSDNFKIDLKVKDSGTTKYQLTGSLSVTTDYVITIWLKNVSDAGHEMHSSAYSTALIYEPSAVLSDPSDAYALTQNTLRLQYAQGYIRSSDVVETETVAP